MEGFNAYQKKVLIKNYLYSEWSLQRSQYSVFWQQKTEGNSSARAMSVMLLMLELGIWIFCG